jgi:uncharacterized protein (TIGR03089 family)
MGDFAARSGITVPSLFAAVVAADPSLPVVTYYDDASGERTELSGIALDNWVAKTANLLVDGCGLGAGATAAIELPPHWQTAAVLLGCWTVGVTVTSGGPADVTFASGDTVIAGAASAGDRYVLGLAPMGLPMREVPAGWLDYVAEVRGHGDRYGGPLARPGDGALLDAAGTRLTQADLVARARERAGRLGLVPGARVLIDADAYPDPLDWLLAPLAAGARIVLCTHTDVAALPARAESEKAVILPPEPLRGP